MVLFDIHKFKFLFIVFGINFKKACLAILPKRRERSSTKET